MRSASLLLTGLLALSHAAVLPSAEEASSFSPLEIRRGGGGDDDKGGSSGSGKGSSGGGGGGSGKCPDVWGRVNADLNPLFMVGNQCNDLARAAIRAIFHDCGTWDTTQGFSGGCDGSLILGVNPDIELNRAENRGLQTISKALKDLAAKHGVSVADMIVFAGSE